MNKLSTSQFCFLVEKANLTLECIIKSIACRSREGILPLCGNKGNLINKRNPPLGKKNPSGMTLVKYGDSGVAEQFWNSRDFA